MGVMGVVSRILFSSDEAHEIKLRRALFSLRNKLYRIYLRTFQNF